MSISMPSLVAFAYLGLAAFALIELLVIALHFSREYALGQAAAKLRETSAHEESEDQP